ncbi:unnamed protein product [Prunus armeniaca]|uniref:Uncharacterized protein n=1 Tax=Prunus armeniaca TaxID=36596 RepID=A0A6J5V7X6_PRUAR|nr:unnamed protein product [Prunus armeniaca]
MSEAGVNSDATAFAAARSKQFQPNNHSADLTRNRPPIKCTKCGLDNHTIKKDGFTNGEIRIRPKLHLHLLSHPKRLHQNLYKVHLAPRPWPPQDLLTRAIIGCGTKRGICII